MRKYLLLWPYIFITLIAPILACGPAAGQRVTPTPTKTPRRVKILPQAPIATTTAVLLPTTAPNSPISPANTPALVPPTETTVPESPPTNTPTPEPPPTDTPPPPPPPPPTNTPPPPPPTNTPAPPPPTQPPANEGPQVTIELPGGDTYDVDEDITIIFVVRDPDGVANFTWGIFTLNQTPLIGGEKGCGGATECRLELNETTPPIPDTYLVGADAVDSKGKTVRQVGEIYVH